jgi:hypothetical protein
VGWGWGWGQCVSACRQALKFPQALTPFAGHRFTPGWLPPCACRRRTRTGSRHRSSGRTYGNPAPLRTPSTQNLSAPVQPLGGSSGGYMGLLPPPPPNIASHQQQQQHQYQVGGRPNSSNPMLRIASLQHQIDLAMVEAAQQLQQAWASVQVGARVPDAGDTLAGKGGGGGGGGAKTPPPGPGPRGAPPKRRLAAPR